MKESVPQEEEFVDDKVTAEGGDPARASAGGSRPSDAEEDEAAGAEEEAAADEALTRGGDAATIAKKLEDLNDRHLRLVAEFNNFRRRTEQERLSAWARAQADVVAKFLDVLDDLHRVAQLDLGNATVEAIMEGIDLVERKFTRMLEDSGVEVIDPTGEAFDPERMEAVMRVPAETDDQDDVVAQVFQKGYTLKGVLVRPARVSVFKQG